MKTAMGQGNSRKVMASNAHACILGSLEGEKRLAITSRPHNYHKDQRYEACMWSIAGAKILGNVISGEQDYLESPRNLFLKLLIK
jgi:hypothetical protein